MTETEAVEAPKDLKIKVGTMPPLQPIPIQTVGKRWKYWIALRAARQYQFEHDWAMKLPSGKIIVIPKGFVTDGASFPWWLPALVAMIGIFTINEPIPVTLYFLEDPLFFIPDRFVLVAYLALSAAAFKMMFAPMGLALVPGLAHDYLYKHHYLLLDDGTRFMEGCTLWQADDLFKRIHLHSNDMMLLAFITWAGLSSGSFLTWRAHRKVSDLSEQETIADTDEPEQTRARWLYYAVIGILILVVLKLFGMGISSVADTLTATPVNVSIMTK